MDITLRNWYLENGHAYGIVKGHKKLSDGTFIVSSKVKSVNVVDSENGSVEIQTENTLYKANLKDAIFNMFDHDERLKFDDFDSLMEKFKDAYDFPDEILKQEGVLIELSRNAQYNYVSCLANVNQKMYKQVSPDVHLGLLEDSVLLRIDGLDEFDCRYFPCKTDTIEFYAWHSPYKVFLKNSSDIKITVKILDFKVDIEPGKVIEVPDYLDDY